MIPRRWAIVAMLLFVVAAVVSMQSHETNLVWPHSSLWSSALMNLGAWYLLLPAALGGWCAWQGWRQKRLGIRRLPAVRSTMTVLTDWYLPALVTCVVAPLAAVAWMAPQLVGRPRPAELLLVPVAVAALMMWSASGALLGRLLPLPLALALGVLVPFLGVGFPEAQASFTYRHVLALHSSCCLIDQQASWRVLVGSALFYGATAAALLWALLRASWLRLSAALLLSLVVFHLAAAIVRPVDNPDGVEPRPANLVCVTGEPTVCLWPEELSRLGTIQQSAAQVRGSLARLGIDTPSVVSSDPTHDWDYVAGLSATSDDQRRLILITGLVAVPMPACAATQPWYAPEAFADMIAWVWLRSGFPQEAVRGTPHLAEVLARPDAEQAAWFTANMKQRSQCQVAPVR